MNTRFETKAAFKLAGLAVHDGKDSDFTGIWEELFSKFKMSNLEGLGTGECYGACYDYKSPDRFSYIAGFDVKDEEKAKLMELDIIDVPLAEYLVVELHGAMPQSIWEGWKFVNETYFPENNFEHAGTPDFEYYLPGDPNDPDYIMELWVPVKAKK